MSRCGQRRTALALLSALLLLASGCWSGKEIEDLSVYVGLGIDSAQKTDFEKYMEQEKGSYPKQNFLTATVQVVPGSFGKGNSPKESGPDGASYENEQLTGDSLLQVFRQFAVRRERPLIGHHLKVIVISTDISRKARMDQLLDFVLRDNDIRPSCLVLASENRAVDALVSVKNNVIPAFYLKGMVENMYLNNKVLEPMTLGKLNSAISSKESFLLQNVLSYKGEHLFSGAAIYRGKTLTYAGSLNQEEIEGLSWLRKEARGGTLKVRNDEGYVVLYEIKKIKKRVTPHLKDGKLSFHVQISCRGWLMEDWSVPEEAGTAAYTRRMEELFSKKAEKEIRQVMGKLQHEYKADVVGFGDKVRIKYPKLWKQVKNDWDTAFSEAPVTYEVKLSITSHGSSTD